MKRKLLKPLFVVLAGLSALQGCGTGESEELGVDVQDDTQYLIPAKTFSCSGLKTQALYEDITAKYLQFSNVTFSWPDPNTNMFISAIFIESTNENFSGGKLNCQVAGNELLAINNSWWDSKKAVIGGPDITVPVTTANPTGTITPLKEVGLTCPVTCGQISTTAKPFTASATMKVFGYKVGKDKQQTPVSTTVYVTVENLF